jgi:hypothetical protein
VERVERGASASKLIPSRVAQRDQRPPLRFLRIFRNAGRARALERPDVLSHE